MSLVSCATLAEVQLKMDNMWADNAVKKDYQVNAEAAIAINENTTAQFPELTGLKDNEVSVKWINICDVDVQDVTDDCNLDTDGEAAVGCETYTLDLEKETTAFKIDEYDLRNKIFELPELMAPAIMKQVKALDEWWADQAVVALDANAGVNVYTSGIGTVASTDTTIPAQMFNLNAMGYFKLVQAKNKFANPYLLSGENLYLDAINAGWNAGNAEGKGAQARTSVYKMYFDLFNVDSTDKKTYMIERGALAFKTKARWGAYSSGAPLDLGKHGKRWSVNSMVLPGVKYDVVYDTECTNSKIFHVFKLKTLGMIGANPTGCSATNTGILSFTCG